MTGNVWEWCLDAFDFQTNNTALRRNPIGGHDSITDLVENYMDIRTERVMQSGTFDADAVLTERVLRSGGWNACAQAPQVTYRTNYPPVNTESCSGFRCVKDVTY